MKRIKNLRVNVKAVGENIVNYGDIKTQRSAMFRIDNYPYELIKNDNVKPAAAQFERVTVDENGKDVYKRIPIVSSVTIKRHLYPGMVGHNTVEYTTEIGRLNVALNPRGLVCGYLIPIKGDNGYGRNSFINVMNARLCNEAVTNFAVHSTDKIDYKSETNTFERSSASLHYVEECGKTEWEFDVYINTSSTNARTLCLDAQNNRQEANPDWFAFDGEDDKVGDIMLKTYFGENNYKRCCVKSKNEPDYLMEDVIYFNDNCIRTMIYDFMERLVYMKFFQGSGWMSTRIDDNAKIQAIFTLEDNSKFNLDITLENYFTFLDDVEFVNYYEEVGTNAISLSQMANNMSKDIKTKKK